VTSGEDETIDFKPFFDLVVGVLFILLILIAAQIFFAQWDPETESSYSAQRETEKRRLALEKEANSFLEDLANRLQRQGFTPTIDRLNFAVSVPAPELLVAVDDGRPWRSRAGAGERLSSAVFTQIGCIAPELPRPSDCRPARLARLSSLTLRLIVSGHDAPTPEPAVRVGALELASAVFSAQPQLLGLRTPQGALVTQAQVGVETAPAASSQRAARVEARFGFVDSTTSTR
jgi:hypothetical protein